MFCNNCGKQVSDQALSCPGCGQPFIKRVNGREISEKSRTAVILLSFFLGVLGVHRFYVGKIGTGILMIITFGGLGIWALIDFIIAVCGKFTDSEGKIISQ